MHCNFADLYTIRSRGLLGSFDQLQCFYMFYGCIRGTSLGIVIIIVMAHVNGGLDTYQVNHR